MKVKKHLLGVLTLGAAMAVFGSLNLASAKEQKQNVKGNKAKVHYMVDGMTCGGCVFGVKHKLKEKEMGLNPDNVDVSVGSVNILFDTGKYQGKQTDCKIIKAIRSVKSDFIAYRDTANKNPCNLN